MADLLSHQNIRNVGDQSNMNLNCGLEFGFWFLGGLWVQNEVRPKINHHMEFLDIGTYVYCIYHIIRSAVLPKKLS